jgi:hypothetical protein
VPVSVSCLCVCCLCVSCVSVSLYIRLNLCLCVRLSIYTRTRYRDGGRRRDGRDGTGMRRASDQRHALHKCLQHSRAESPPPPPPPISAFSACAAQDAAAHQPESPESAAVVALKRPGLPGGPEPAGPGSAVGAQSGFDSLPLPLPLPLPQSRRWTRGASQCMLALSSWSHFLPAGMLALSSCSESRFPHARMHFLRDVNCEHCRGHWRRLAWSGHGLRRLSSGRQAPDQSLRQHSDRCPGPWPGCQCRRVQVAAVTRQPRLSRPRSRLGKESDAPGRGALPGPVRVLRLIIRGPWSLAAASPAAQACPPCPSHGLGPQLSPCSPVLLRLQRGYQATVTQLTILC